MLKSKLSTFMTLIALAVTVLFGYLFLRDLQGPSLNFSVDNLELGQKIGPRKEIKILAGDTSGVRKIKISVKRGSKTMELYEKAFLDTPKSTEYAFTLEDAKLPEGAFTLIVSAHDASFAGFNKGNGTTKEIQLVMDNKQPRIIVETTPPAVHRGGSALIVYKVSEEVKKTGVYVNSHFFPAYLQKENTYACLFAFPESVPGSEYFPQIMAEDTAGNITESRLIVNAVNRNYPNDKVNITDNFLNLKAEELQKIVPYKDTTLERYLEANGKAGLENDRLIHTVCIDKSTPKPKWKDDFKILPRSAVKAQFGDRRTYYLNGKEIDKQVHLGYDFASVAHDTIPAGNHGTVVFTGYNGIYGNLVILEHGLGLNSIYSHMSEIFVNEGDVVEKGQALGLTGTTGLAVGDHVHFGVYVGGIAVQPKEWIDPKWIRNNISARLVKTK